MGVWPTEILFSAQRPPEKPDAQRTCQAQKQREKDTKGNVRLQAQGQAEQSESAQARILEDVALSAFAGASARVKYMPLAPIQVSS